MSEKEKNYLTLKEWALSQGMSLFGAADLAPFRNEAVRLSPTLLTGFDSAISLAVRLSAAVLEDIDDRPTELYLHHYRQANFFLDRVAFGLALQIEQRGYSALHIPASQIINWERQQGHLSHKRAAVEAGLGWIGRNNLLVTPVHGARIRLVTVLTSLPLQHDHPIGESCGSCRRCIALCPAGAIRERPEEFAHRDCYEQLCLFRKRDHIAQHICGVCVKACSGERDAPSP
jgi:epoxyqueuosine reductase QueG